MSNWFEAGIDQSAPPSEKNSEIGAAAAFLNELQAPAQDTGPLMRLAQQANPPEDQSPEQTQSSDLKPPILGDASSFPDEHKQLLDLATSKIKGGDLKKFEENMNAFESRILSGNLDAGQVKAVYSEVERLFNSTTDDPVSVKDKIKLAQQILDQCARPQELDQGQHKTCSVTTIESRMYTRDPKSAAKLVADVALTGSFTTKDGRTITLTKGSLDPDREASSTTTSDGLRSFASQIFQITAVNIHWSRMRVTPDSKLVPAGSIKYEQDPGKAGPNEFGELLRDHSTDPPRELSRQPSMSVGSFEYISNQITGLSEKDFVIEHSKRSDSNTVTIETADEFKNTVLDAKKNGALPVIVRVHTGNRPFSQSGGVWHVVSVVDIDEVKGEVKVDNQWGRGNDRWVKISTLHRAMLDPQDKLSVIPGLPIRRSPVILER